LDQIRCLWEGQLEELKAQLQQRDEALKAFRATRDRITAALESRLHQAENNLTFANNALGKLRSEHYDLVTAHKRAVYERDALQAVHDTTCKVLIDLMCAVGFSDFNQPDEEYYDGTYARAVEMLKVRLDLANAVERLVRS
jgi:DNA repair exonuclease SbcCD ATPase subunit